MDDPLQEIIYRDQVRFSFAGEYQPLPDACPGVVEIAAIGLEDKKWREKTLVRMVPKKIAKMDEK